jgi:hypothetical protein
MREQAGKRLVISRADFKEANVWGQGKSALPHKSKSYLCKTDDILPFHRNRPSREEAFEVCTLRPISVVVSRQSDRRKQTYVSRANGPQGKYKSESVLETTTKTLECERPRYGFMYGAGIRPSGPTRRDCRQVKKEDGKIPPHRRASKAMSCSFTELGIDPWKANQNYERDPVLIFEWLELLRGAMAKVGLDMTVASSFKQLLGEIGFVDVVETGFEIPWGTRAKERREKVIGFWHIEQLKQGLQGIIMRLFSRVYGWSSERVELFLVALRQDLDDKEFHMLDHG